MNKQIMEENAVAHNTHTKTGKNKTNLKHIIKKNRSPSAHRKTKTAKKDNK